MGSEAKPGKAAMKGWAQRYLNLSFVAGFLLVLLTYVVLSQPQRFAAISTTTSPNAVAKMAPRVTAAEHRKSAATEAPGETGEEKKEQMKPEASGNQDQDEKQQGQEEETWRTKDEDSAATVTATEEPRTKRDDRDVQLSEEAKVVCNRDGPFSDTCEVTGDVRINGSALSVTLLPSSRQETTSRRQQWKIRPYSRRTMTDIREVTVTQLASADEASAAPACTVTHEVPAIVFALGGLTGNYFHDFSDALVPLFVASRRYGGEVLFLVSNIQPWWLAKYGAVVRRLSKYDAVDLDKDNQTRCFRHVSVGLRLTKEFDIAAGKNNPLSMPDFTAFLRETYSLPRNSPTKISLGATGSNDDNQKPRLMLIHRSHYRKLLNVPEIVAAAESAGFAVTISDPRFDVRISDLAKSVNSFDVLMGVHGAGLTNAAFLPPGGVVIQVVPYGKMEGLARTDFGEPVKDMGLEYLEYSVSAQESSLLEMLGPEHLVIKDPEAVHRSGWDKVAEYYLGKQDVRLDVERFRPTLDKAMEYLRQR
ncbi:uncharacterized protein LOC100844253 [Brachypodium distachyon]|uniref:Glycosyltransferase 61 catalytic domain-containing protein n=1 Tax=Brachypodium distachyon TaxID=15368 RepID=A0A0Q3FW70_BRADI|nr:uncharacterized protein LOC100844253 [Brachypodium distachyon]KQK02437.1 hypothetical protein BRADI_2g01420v3 [Brachypodium distachyon]|eukprot:XP_010230381.1 uncharacterized protein LOC100844253 [Brachypodium distachyon]